MKLSGDEDEGTLALMTTFQSLLELRDRGHFSSVGVPICVAGGEDEEDARIRLVLVN